MRRGRRSARSMTERHVWDTAAHAGRRRRARGVDPVRARRAHHPAPGEIAHSVEDWEQAGGGGGVAAIQLALLADEAHLFTALGDDELGRRSQAELEERGVTRARDHRAAPARMGVHAHRRGRASGRSRPSGPSCAQRETTTRCRGTSWPRWTPCSSSRATSRRSVARGARRVLTATAREIEILRRGAVELDALIGSGEDEAERYHAGDLDPEPRLVVTTSGALGGWMQPGGPFTAAPVPGPARGHLRVRRLVHGRSHLRARGRARARTTRSRSQPAAARRR